MKTFAFATAITAACSAISLAASPELPTVNQLQVFPKNLARQHYGANLFVYDTANTRFAATEAAAAWLDEDAVTGWPALAGRQHYLLQLSEPQMITNFALSAQPGAGVVSLYTSDQAMPPGDVAWTQVAKDVPLEKLNQKHLAKPLNKTAKYVLIETNIPEPGPIYSLYLYGAKAAASESIVARPESIEVKTLGDFVNQQTAFNVAALYANGRVSYANAKGSAVTWQRAIDDNSETSVALAPSTKEAGAVVRFSGEQPVSRLSFLGDLTAHGTLDVFLLSQAPEANQSVGLEGVTPSASIKFDGTTGRGSADLAETKAVAVAFRWTPETGSAPLNVREFAAFANISLTEHYVGGAQPVIAEAEPGSEKDMEKQAGTEGTLGSGKDSKDVIAAGPGEPDFKGGKAMKEPLPPVAAGPGGFTPGGLGFPPRTLLNPVSP